MQDYSQSAIDAAAHAQVAYCKFISPNDAGVTGAHQSGYHISRDAFSLIFPEPCVKGQNRDKWVTIKWQDDFETSSRFIYYGELTRNEYRLTRTPRETPFSGDDSVGNLLIICKQAEDFYSAYVLQTEDEIENFLNYFGLSPSEANGLISTLIRVPQNAEVLMRKYISRLVPGFPRSRELSSAARSIYERLSGVSEESFGNEPDKAITSWIDTEYSLFQEVEKSRYREPYLSSAFGDVDSLVEAANSILNRRKSRAGHSLENHLARIFDINELPYTAQCITEGHKKPDFIMPSIELYHETSYNADKLVFLAAKTTCKDRWRQVLNEAARTPHKHLFTLQQGISANQLDEMRSERLTLVVPEKHLSMFPETHRSDILTLKQFIANAKTTIAG